jgi:hypothetical protein
MTQATSKVIRGTLKKADVVRLLDEAWRDELDLEDERIISKAAGQNRRIGITSVARKLGVLTEYLGYYPGGF